MKKKIIILSCISAISYGASLSSENGVPKEVSKSAPSPKTPIETRRNRAQAFIHNIPQPTTTSTRSSLLTQALREHGMADDKKAPQGFEQNTFSSTSENKNPQQQPTQPRNQKRKRSLGIIHHTSYPSSQQQAPSIAPAPAQSSTYSKATQKRRRNKKPEVESLHDALIPKHGQVPDSDYGSSYSSPLGSY